MSAKEIETLQQENAELKALIVQFKRLLDSIPDPVFMKDEGLHWIYGNPVILDLYSIDRDNYVGKTEDQLLPKEFADSCMESDRQAVAKGTISKSEERARDAEDNIHFYEVFKVPSYDPEDGAFLGLIGVGRDITERKAAQEALEVENNKRKENEKELRELTETLEQKVLQRTEELNRQRLKAEYLATVDVLTELNNRRAFYEKSIAVHQEAKRYRHTYSVIVLDVDLFKKVNDTYGHAVGDEALKMLASIIKSALRESDVEGRVGGEEFAITLPNTTVDGAVELAQRICNKVEQSALDHENKKILLTVSLGVSEVKPEYKCFDELVAKADKALYLAKNSGRNCVMVQ